MHRSKPAGVVLCATLLLLAAFMTACSDEASGGELTPTATGDATATEATSGGAAASDDLADAAPPEVRDAAEADWPVAHNNYRNTREADGAEINASNVADLGVAWSRGVAMPPELAFGVLAANPIVIDGVVYIQDLNSNVYALDLESGETVWTQPLDELSEGPNGVAIGYGRVYAATRTHVYALNIENGEIEWERELVTSPTAGIDIQPVVFDGLVYTSTVPGNAEEFYAGGDTGVLYALDAETGEVEWEFDTVKADDLWGNEEVNSGGGAWFPAAIDPETGVTYWGIGNPAPWPGTPEFPEGSSRPGPNLYTNSLVALDGQTGELLWYNQVRPHDLFDHDFQISPIIQDVEIEGEQVRAVIGAGKMGAVVGFDAETGETLWVNEVGTHMNDLLDDLPDEGEERVEVWPAPIGGVETPMAAADGVVYEVNIDIPSFWDAVGYEVDLSQGQGQIYAIDAATGKTLWSQQLTTGLPLGGVTVVNDLVLTATNDGTMYAFQRETGEEVWTLKAPAGINAQPAVVGDTIVWPAGVPQGSQQAILFALRLGGDGEFAVAEGAEVLGQAVVEAPSDSAQPEGDEAPEEEEPGADTGEAGAEVPIDLTASSIAFSTNEISVPAGADVVITFTNEDAVGHDFDLYESPAAEQQLFDGEVITGPGETITYEFTAPEEPGDYFFNCSVHPQQMTGTFIVE